MAPEVVNLFSRVLMKVLFWWKHVKELQVERLSV